MKATMLVPADAARSLFLPMKTPNFSPTAIFFSHAASALAISSPVDDARLLFPPDSKSPPLTLSDLTQQATPSRMPTLPDYDFQASLP